MQNSRLAVAKPPLTQNSYMICRWFSVPNLIFKCQHNDLLFDGMYHGQGETCKGKGIKMRTSAQPHISSPGAYILLRMIEWLVLDARGGGGRADPIPARLVLQEEAKIKAG